MGFATGKMIIRTLIFAGAIALMPGCGGGSGATDDGSGDLPAGTDLQDVDTTGDALDRPATIIDEDFRIVATRHPPLSQRQIETLILDPREQDWSRPVVSIDGLLGEDTDCSQGCLIGKDFNWLAVNQPTSPGSAEPPGIALASIDHSESGLGVKFLEIDPLQNVRHLAFHGSNLYWSRKRDNCDADTDNLKTCWDFLRMNLATPDIAELLFTFPTKAILATSQASGYFTLGEDGTTIVLQSPTTNSLSFWVARKDGSDKYSLSRVGKAICHQTDANGRCTGSTDFTDQEPVAVSPDGRSLVAAVIVDDRRLSLLHFDLGFPGPPLEERQPDELILMGVPDFQQDYNLNGYRATACYNRAGKPWRYTGVLSPIRFTSRDDDSEVLLVGQSDCKVNPQGPNKVWTNVAALPLKTLAAGQADREAIRFVTDFPEGYKAANVSIQNRTMDLSPSGEYVVFVGTAFLGSDGQAIKDDQEKHVTDFEIWATRLDGTREPTQVTGDDPITFWKYLTAATVALPTR